ncbi:hypothetical protein GCM10010272_57900 [Streptomyces lateritius]|nr:hypothetical protein GCM10010272_57900 [Streptomyces lateritius]
MTRLAFGSMYGEEREDGQVGSDGGQRADQEGAEVDPGGDRAGVNAGAEREALHRPVRRGLADVLVDHLWGGGRLVDGGQVVGVDVGTVRELDDPGGLGKVRHGFSQVRGGR